MPIGVCCPIIISILINFKLVTASYIFRYYMKKNDTDKDIEKFDGILNTLLGMQYTDEEQEAITSVFLTDTNEKLINFFKFLNSQDFSGKVSLAAFKKMMSKNDISEGLDIFSLRKKPIDEKYSRLVNGFDKLKRSGLKRKCSFKDMIDMSKTKRRIGIDPSISHLSNEKVINCITKYLLLTIFTQWKEDKYLSSSIIDDIQSNGFNRRISTTFKATIRKMLDALKITFNELDGNTINVTDIVNTNFHFGYGAMPAINTKCTVSYPTSIRSMYSASFMHLSNLVNSYSSYNNFGGFERIFITHHLDRSSFFTYNVYNNHDYNISSSELSLYSLDMAVTNQNNLRDSNEDRHLFVEKYKSFPKDLESNISTTLVAINRSINLLKEFYLAQSNSYNIKEYFKYLSAFPWATQTLNYREPIHNTSIFGLIRAYVKEMSIILTSVDEDTISRYHSNNSFTVFLSYFHRICSTTGILNTPLTINLFPHDANDEVKVQSIFNMFNLIQSPSISSATNGDLGLFSHTEMYTLSVGYKNFISKLDPSIRVGVDTEDNLLFFRHLSEFFVGPISLLDPIFNTDPHTLFERALAKFDGDTLV